MKRIILFFAVCLGLSVSQTTFADDAETVRAASKRTSTTAVTTSTNTTTNSNRSVASNTKKTETTKEKNSRTAVKPTQQRVVSRTPAQQQPAVKSRTTTQPTQEEKTSSSTRNISTTSRTAATRTVDARKTESNAKKASRTATTKKAKHISRAAELNAEKIDNIKSKDYSKCKTVYFECMDEFCANKDTNLRRCACSSRIHEFDSIKKQLSEAEDKMLDFNQRLLTVSLEKEDAAAINVATEGELAYDKKDRTESEKLLQKITNTLNSSGDTRLNNDLSSISLSLDMDTAWDDIDSMGGIATSAKEGLDLYNAATPVCVEMAKEICSDEELDIAQNSYKLTIQQDCNTVAKSYDTLYNQAQEKIHESSALLDMSRLNIYQQRNSDDILTCKKKILAQLSDASVCGENLYKCLDTTGQYINPSTGKAVLTKNLYNLTSLLKEPTGDEKWSKISQNEKFVKFLNSKKEFLEPAIEQCQDISDTVWKDFLDDALSQIKLAQNSKLEEIRQSCTTLVAECKTTSLTDLSEFDARALSTFSVLADATANSMCKDIETSCVALMDNIDSTGLWKSGIAGISTDISYNTILETCTQIGRDCIIQQCNGTSGNFALCKKTTDGKRADVLTRRACFQEVWDCVKQADKDNIENMTYGILPSSSSSYSEARENYYISTYKFSPAQRFEENQNDNDTNQLNSGIPQLCSDNTDKTCLIAEQIWGNCEHAPEKFDIVSNSDVAETDNYLQTSNKILIPKNGTSTLLSWFASNTGTAVDTVTDSCNARGCPVNYKMNTNNECEKVSSTCFALNDVEENNGRPQYCITNDKYVINVTDSITNWCESGEKDIYGNCCKKGTSRKDSNGICVPNIPGYTPYESIFLQNITCDGSSNDNTEDHNYLCPDGTKRKMSVYCVHTTTQSEYYIQSETGTSVSYACPEGFWLLVDQYGNYFNLKGDTGDFPKQTAQMSYKTAPNSTPCTYGYNSEWQWTGTCDNTNAPGKIPTDNEFMILY